MTLRKMLNFLTHKWGLNKATIRLNKKKKNNRTSVEQKIDSLSSSLDALREMTMKQQVKDKTHRKQDVDCQESKNIRDGSSKQ